MSQPFNQLTNARAERLHILLEELGEAQQAIGKILRHGYESGWNGSNNRRDLEKELGHVAYAVEMLMDKGDISGTNGSHSRADKRLSIQPFLHHQDED